MRRIQLLPHLILAVACSNSFGQSTDTSVPIGDSVSKALAMGTITGEGAQAFHIRVEVSEPENPQSPYQGAFDEWWASPDQWRREVTTKDGMRQTIVVADSKKTEKDEADYFPVWMRNFVRAVFEPVPNATAWTGSGIMVEQFTTPMGNKSDACAVVQSKIGSAGRDSTVNSRLCFDDDGRLKFFLSPGYHMEFLDYRSFGPKQIARKLVSTPEAGTTLVGKVTTLEDESEANGTANLFVPLPADEDRFRAVQVSAEAMEKLTANAPPIVWPPVHLGKLSGRVAIYISVDAEGRVREAWPINADNSVDDSAREQVQKWTIKPAIDETGKRVQVDGDLSLTFETRLEDPMVYLSDAEIRQLATKVVNPVLPPNSVRPGDVIEVDISVNEKGERTGMACRNCPRSVAAISAAFDALKQWRFRPLILDGKPRMFHGPVSFVVVR